MPRVVVELPVSDRGEVPHLAVTGGVRCDQPMGSSKRRNGSRKPCSVCRQWFEPDARVGRRQRTCGPECRKKHKKRMQQQWSERNPACWTERRLRQQAEDLGDGKTAGLRGPPAVLSGLPIEWAQAEMSPEALVIIVFLLKVLYRATQVEMRQQVREIKREIGEVQQSAPQVEIGVEGKPP